MSLLAQFCYADSSSPPQTEQIATRNTDALNPTAPYCGVQAVCLAARALGRDVDFSQMVRPQYIGSKQGSSLAELRLLCDDLNLQTKVFSRLTINSLYGATSPLILHTSSQADPSNYDHWTLFTGIKNGKAMTWKVIDGQSIYEAVSLNDLAVKWSGNALMVFDDYASGIYFAIFVWAERIFLLGIAALSILIFANINSFFRRYGNRVQVCAGLFVILFASALAHLMHSYVLYPESFLVNDNAIRKIQEDNLISFLPTISLDRAKKSHNDENAIIVDARLEHQYRQGHIEGSINIPPTMPLSEIDAVLRDHAKDTVIIVVYESFACARAIDVFRRIKQLGFNNIYRFEDGWDKWKKKVQ